MPVLPLVGSSSSFPGWSPAAWTIFSATRSLIEPVGFWPSSFAYSLTAGVGDSRGSSTSGVLPTRSRSEPAGSATGHGRKQDHRRAVVDRRLEPVAGADVLALDVDVDEWRQLVLREQPPGHGGRQDPRRAVVARRLEPVAGADVLALDVDVDEWRQLVLREQLPAQGREASRQVVEQLGNSAAVRLHPAR